MLALHGLSSQHYQGTFRFDADHHLGKLATFVDDGDDPMHGRVVQTAATGSNWL